MITIPLAWVVSILTIIAGVALAQNTRLPLPTRIFLGLFMLSLATTAALLGLRLTYGVLWAARVQPFIAALVAPLAYLGFRALTQETQAWHKAVLWLDLAVVALALLVMGPAPGLTDLMVMALTFVYLVRLGLLLLLGADAFLHVPPTSFGVLRAALIACVALLGALAITDLVIALTIFFGGESYFRQLLSGASGVFVLGVFLIALVGVPLVMRQSETTPKPGKPADLTGGEVALLTRLGALMRNNQLYTDSSLTLARVARRLSVPARDVSAAVNRGTGENFSRYVNRHRIDHARELLAQGGLSVTDVMLESGFVSKSSFNAEFRRITGQTPSEFRAAHPGNLTP